MNTTFKANGVHELRDDIVKWLRHLARSAGPKPWHGKRETYISQQSSNALEHAASELAQAKLEITDDLR